MDNDAEDDMMEEDIDDGAGGEVGGLDDLPEWGFAAEKLVEQLPPAGEVGSPLPPPLRKEAPVSQSPPVAKKSLSAPTSVKSVLDGQGIYIYGTGADFKKKTTATLRVDDSGTVSAIVEDGRALNLYELAVVACNRSSLIHSLSMLQAGRCSARGSHAGVFAEGGYPLAVVQRETRAETNPHAPTCRFRRPRTSIKMVSTGEELGAYEVHPYPLIHQSPSPCPPAPSSHTPLPHASLRAPPHAMLSPGPFRHLFAR